jgi:hypothetical protein
MGQGWWAYAPPLAARTHTHTHTHTRCPLATGLHRWAFSMSFVVVLACFCRPVGPVLHRKPVLQVCRYQGDFELPGPSVEPGAHVCVCRWSRVTVAHASATLDRAACSPRAPGGFVEAGFCAGWGLSSSSPANPPTPLLLDLSQVIGMFHWDGVSQLVVKVMDQDVVSDDCNGIAVISYVPRSCVVTSSAVQCQHPSGNKCSASTKT